MSKKNASFKYFKKSKSGHRFADVSNSKPHFIKWKKEKSKDLNQTLQFSTRQSASA